MVLYFRRQARPSRLTDRPPPLTLSSNTSQPRSRPPVDAVRDARGVATGKKKSTSSTTNTYGFIQQPDNAHYAKANDYLNNIDYHTPITQQYGQLQRQIQESGNDYFGHNESPEVRDKIRQARLFRAKTDYGTNLSNAAAAENQAKMQGEMGLGAATAPMFVQTGGSSQGAQWGSGLYSPAGEAALSLGTGFLGS